MTWNAVRRLAAALPRAVEGTSYGTPAFHIGKKFLLRLKEDGETIAIRISFDEREILMRAKPKTFYITDHYRDYPAVLVRLSAISEGEMKDLLQRSHAFTAPARKRG
ncbi:MAG: MmcQ/YjbR family DNA-binding protein [Acidobacteriota bacterium]|nr:MmcQ/YjbR family DNA-binding protein [Acidobacteriota bacterium]